MTTFNLAAYPCERFPDGIVSIVITGCFARAKVDCKVAELPVKMQAFAAENACKIPGSIYVSADPDGRAPNGWRLIVAAKKDAIIYDQPAKVAA